MCMGRSAVSRTCALAVVVRAVGEEEKVCWIECWIEKLGERKGKRVLLAGISRQTYFPPTTSTCLRRYEGKNRRDEGLYISPQTHTRTHANADPSSSQKQQTCTYPAVPAQPDGGPKVGAAVLPRAPDGTVPLRPLILIVLDFGMCVSGAV